MKRSRILKTVLKIIGIAVIALLLLPLAVTAAGSVMSRTDLNFYYFGRERIEYFKFAPDNFTLSQYYDALIGNTDYTRAFLNSVEYSAISTALAMVIAIPAAYSLALCKFPFKRAVAAVYFLLMDTAVPVDRDTALSAFAGDRASRQRRRGHCHKHLRHF